MQVYRTGSDFIGIAFLQGGKCPEHQVVCIRFQALRKGSGNRQGGCIGKRYLQHIPGVGSKHHGAVQQMVAVGALAGNMQGKIDFRCGELGNHRNTGKT